MKGSIDRLLNQFIGEISRRSIFDLFRCTRPEDDHFLLFTYSLGQQVDEMGSGSILREKGDLHPGDRVILILGRFLFHLIDQELKFIIADLTEQFVRSLVV